MNLRCIHESRSVLGEGAFWSAKDDLLYWIDQMRPELHRFDPRTGRDEKLDVGPLPEQLGALVARSSGGFVLAGSDGISFVDFENGTRTPFVNPIADMPRASFNDAKSDRQGRLWAGTTDRLETDRLGRLYRIEANGQTQPINDGYVCSNGPSFSPDGRILYHTRSQDRAIWAYDIDLATGAASNGRVFATIEEKHGIPDGSTVDAEGFLWSTHWGGWRITRYRPDGTEERVIEMPVKSPTSCAFGGPDLRTLYITSASIEMIEGTWVYMDEAGFEKTPFAGALFAIDVDVPGLIETPFAG
ncbi:hypothetical protein GCM10011491_23050 [Brucella endophytica]|uniref:SMP-30/Gluconolactonase/LRE-like region domain-containing protein n=1 Tax=Brucella endophytica TaxID=1963359 RepID=A0A916SDA3_9HYPH|nr:SMP-30/gluconolactonase/LRE family protein [Brucella endophytica]GGA94208.1 hypothetical protein GCM10011491_23050 [Brucella endophytica]